MASNRKRTSVLAGMLEDANARALLQPRAEPSFSVTPEEADLVDRIVERAAANINRQRGKRCTKVERLTLEMDLKACHANGMPMRFDKLLAADDFNFVHDVNGIARHMDRTTGKLQNCFVPRFAAHQHQGR